MNEIEEIRELCDKIEAEYAKDGHADDDIIVALLSKIELIVVNKLKEWI